MLAEYDLRKIEVRSNFDGLYVKTHVTLIYREFFGIIQ